MPKSRGRRKFKRMMAHQFEVAGGDVSLGGTINRLLVEDRNKACIKVLQQQLTAGKKKIAIFYGAAHMPDFNKRLACVPHNWATAGLALRCYGASGDDIASIRR